MVDEITDKRPSSQARPALKLYFDNLPGVEDIDFGIRMTRARFASHLNAGYIVKFNLHDPHFNSLAKLVEEGYFKLSRHQPIKIRFQLMASKDGGEYPATSTKEQIAYLTEMTSKGTSADTSNLEFIAIDPASYLLNKGSGSGKAYVGKVSNVIKQVVSEYAQDIELDISETTDSDKNRFWMMRQDPQSFITSLLEWSSPLTQNKTQWIVSADGTKLQIKEQADIKPRERAYYTFWERGSIPGRDTINAWELVTDNALSLLHTKIISQGLSAISGAYFDKITDANESKTAATDETTERKILASVTNEQSFTKPSQQIVSGASSVLTIPEMYSAGDVGLEYDDYLDGRARNLWLNLTRHLVQCKFRVLGHGEWSDGFGLGTDTIKIMWMGAPRTADAVAEEWFMTGNWLVHGFEHDLTAGYWWTDIYASRFDWDAIGTKFPGS